MMVRRQFYYLVLHLLDEATVAPTEAQTHINKANNSPHIFSDGHGVEVDLWGIGELINASALNFRKPAWELL
jgi:hypothetical protein